MRCMACCMIVGLLLTTSATPAADAGRRPAKLYEVRPRSPEPGTPATLPAFPSYKTRSQFASDDDYGTYVRATLTTGMRVRARVDYERVKKGMRGTYFGTNDGNPPCLIMWDDDLKSSSALIDLFPRSRASHAYWIYWHQVELNLD